MYNILMYHNTTLKELMLKDLPSLTYQRKISYRTSIREVKALYRLINTTIFNDRLVMPKIYVKPRLREMWGQCYGADTPFSNTRSRCAILLADRWYCRQWLIMAVAHEMVHQYQWDILGPQRQAQGQQPLMSHGPSFFVHRTRLASIGIPLLKKVYVYRWFEYQDLKKL